MLDLIIIGGGAAGLAAACAAARPASIAFFTSATYFSAPLPA